MTELGRLLQAHMDAATYGASTRQVAARIGVAPTALARWRDGGMTRLPKAGNLHAAARAWGVPYPVVLRAALVDAGYVEGELLGLPEPVEGQGWGGQLGSAAAGEDAQGLPGEFGGLVPGDGEVDQ